MWRGNVMLHLPDLEIPRRTRQSRADRVRWSVIPDDVIGRVRRPIADAREILIDVLRLQRAVVRSQLRGERGQRRRVRRCAVQ